MNRNLLNSNRGTVTRILDGGMHIELRLPRGGRIQCANRGFEVGEVVCFTLDATGRNIIHVLPKDIADLKVAIAQDPMLTASLMEYDDDTIEDDQTDYGQEDEGGAHQGRGIHRGGVDVREYYGLDPIDYEDCHGFDDIGDSDPDPSGETAPDEVLVHLEYGYVPELVRDDNPFA